MKIFSSLLLLIISFHVFGQAGEETFTVSGSFTVPAGVTSINIEVIGAGGSGGGNGTGGGGGGGYATGTMTVTPLDILTVIVGSPGSGAIIGTTSVDGLISATGGENGVSVPNPEIGGGGDGGTGLGGAINHNGGNGGGGYYTYFGGGGGGAAGPSGNGMNGGNTIAWTGICHTPGGDGGLSGGTPGGDGGKGAGFTDDVCVITDPSASGNNYGGGGGGGNGNGGGPGNGAAGYCRIWWCDVNVGLTFTEGAASADAVDVLYQWIDCDDNNSAIVDETNQVFHPETAGNYAVIITDGSCVDTSACFFLAPEQSGIFDAETNYLSIAENPFSNYIQINNLIGDEYFTLINISGQIVFNGYFIQQKDLSYLHAGIYFLKAENIKGIKLATLVKD